MEYKLVAKLLRTCGLVAALGMMYDVMRELDGTARLDHNDKDNNNDVNGWDRTEKSKSPLSHRPDLRNDDII